MTTEIKAPTQNRKRTPLEKAGCGALLIIWFTVLMLPCFFGILATQQQIVIVTGSVPGQELRIWLIMQPFERGLGISNGNAHFQSNNRVCIETSVNYVLWAGNVEPSPYTECYERENANAPWEFISTEMQIESEP